MLSHRKTFLDQLPLIALLVITSAALGGVYYLWAHPAGQGLSVNVNGVTIQNPYYYGSGELPDLDNCPGGPGSKPCTDEFGIQISCYNQNQDDADADLIGDLCDPTFDTPPPPVCNDGLDNDGDGFCDVAGSTCPAGITVIDPGCDSPWDTDEHNSSIECDDGINNDNDPGNQIDLADPGCADLADNDESNCGDGICEGGELPVVCALDCGLPPACGDGLDNDADTKTDFPADPGCSSLTDTDEHGTAQCDNGSDDDADTKTDFPADPGCSSLTDTDEHGTAQCDNGTDDDADTKTDFPADPGCSSLTDTDEHGTAQCDNGSDDDADTKTDFPADPGCSSLTDTDEHGTAQCDNGSDDDADTKTDFPADPGCSSLTDTDEHGTAQCDNGTDDDGDTKTDFPADPGCSSLTDTDEHGTAQPNNHTHQYSY